MIFRRIAVLAGLAAMLFACAVSGQSSERVSSAHDTMMPNHSCSGIIKVHPNFAEMNRGAESGGWLLRLSTPHTEIMQGRSFVVAITATNVTNKERAFTYMPASPSEDYFLLIEDSSGKTTYLEPSDVVWMCVLTAVVRPGGSHIDTYPIGAGYNLAPGKYRITAASDFCCLGERSSAYVVSNSIELTIVGREEAVSGREGKADSSLRTE